MEERIRTSRECPQRIVDKAFSHAAFEDGKVLHNKKNGRLPAMGWNSWNAFGSGNTEALTKVMADKMVELGLDKLGYQYIVLDDGCYKSERVDGKLSNEEVKFPNDFSVLAEYIHSKGLKFGMYNDIGTNLCAGSEVGTCGYEDVDAKSYIDWNIDFIKVDNCYYLWDNATFSNGENAKYTYAPNIKKINIKSICELDAVNDGELIGQGAVKHRDGYVTNIGTFDGTNIGTTPVGARSGELMFKVNVPEDGEYELIVTYATGREVGTGCWLQVAVGNEESEIRYYDDMLSESASTTEFVESPAIKIELRKGENVLRLMNHRRQENTLNSYAALLAALNTIKPDNDVVLSICEWGKTQPHNWGYKVGSSWRILNDITFMVGSDGNPGNAKWQENGTASITSQYDKCVVMDEFAGLDKGWNDPDMLVVGMNGINNIMNKTHMTMWCMMNSPLMLGLDLRRVTKGDELWQIIANKDAIDLNQDSLGIQAKRIYCSLEDETPDTTYITNHERVDVLAKPLSNGDIAISFINLDEKKNDTSVTVDIERITSFIGSKMVNVEEFKNAKEYEVFNVWTKEKTKVAAEDGFTVNRLAACDSVTYRITPVK